MPCPVATTPAGPMRYALLTFTPVVSLVLAVVVTVNVFHAHCSLSRDARFSLTVTVHLSPRLLLPPLSLPPLLFLPPSFSPPPRSLGSLRSSCYAYSMKRSGKEDRRFASQRRRQARADSSGDNRDGMLRRRLHSPRHRGDDKQSAVLPTPP